MNSTPLAIPDVILVEPRIFDDSRGYFFEFFRHNVFSDFGPRTQYVQQSESRSRYGVLRGLHYQLPPHAQTKVIRVVEGVILDVAVDIRQDSATFGEHVAVELSANNKSLLVIPRGFAHGFSVLSDNATINYMVDNYYAPESERGIVFNDPDLGIDWKLDPETIELSEKDARYPGISQAELFPTSSNLYEQ